MANFVGDLEEILNTLRQVGLMLNPSKCTFDIKLGKFLGHIFSHRGLKANPEKTPVFADIKSLKNIREVQALTSRSTALG